ncbi:MAG: DUF5810 domain-containing protein [Haloquadratum sp.]
MGFACPVCETPQQDATHLANHLAFTAMVHGDEHEAWLDEHIPGWSQYGEDELAPEVAALAEETDYEQVFEDTASGHGRLGAHGHAPDDAVDVDPEAAARSGRGSFDEETRAVLDEARELTAQMLAADPDERDADRASDDE